MEIQEAPRKVEESDFRAGNRPLFRSMPLAFRIVALQCVLVVALAMTLLLFDRARALAVLAAGIVVTVPSAGFAWRVAASDVPAGQELDAARRLLFSGVLKTLVTFGLLVVTFAWLRPEPVAFFATMIVLQVVYWLAPALARR